MGLQGVYEITLRNNFSLGLHVTFVKCQARHLAKSCQHEQPDKNLVSKHAMRLSARGYATRTPVSPLNRFILLRWCANQMNLQAGGVPADSLPV